MIGSELIRYSENLAIQATRIADNTDNTDLSASPRYADDNFHLSKDESNGAKA